MIPDPNVPIRLAIFVAIVIAVGLLTNKCYYG